MRNVKRERIVVRPDLTVAGKAAKMKPVRPQIGRENPRRMRIVGMGDFVELFAKPIAVKIDRLTKRFPKRFRTRLAGCSACSFRRKFLNAACPNIRSLRMVMRAPVQAARLVRQARRPPQLH